MTSSRYVPPPSRVETLDIRTADGWSLRADVHEPEGPMAGVVVMAHALMARRSEFDKPEGSGLASFFAKRGWCAIPFDFRAHGDSGKPVHRGGHYSYDDLVGLDLPAVCAFARERAGDQLPVVVLGHSLGGHVTLAAQGSGLIQVDAVVGIASALWLREFVSSTREWLVKRGIMTTFDGVSRAMGRFPARTFGLGSDDVARPWIEDFQRYASTGRWTSADGRTDYREALGQVRVPFLQVLSDGDRLEGPPELGERFARACGGPVAIIRIERRDDGGPPPGHMAIVMSSRLDTVRARIEAWMRASARAR
jgi:predicted alpha/beta hydrolase